MLACNPLFSHEFIFSEGERTVKIVGNLRVSERIIVIVVYLSHIGLYHAFDNFPNFLNSRAIVLSGLHICGLTVTALHTQ